MANPIRGEHTIETEDGKFTLCLDMDAFTEACAVLDCGINRLMEMLEGDDPKPHVIRALLYGALKRHNPIPLEDVMSFVQAFGLVEMTGELKTLAMKTMPTAKGGPEGNVTAAATQRSSKPQPRKKAATFGGGKKKQ